MVFFDVHPPLGKLFIALGEKMFNPNRGMDLNYPSQQALHTAQANGNFSFVGVRFFPSLFGFLNGMLIFLIFYSLSKRNLLSLLFSSLYLFENASIASFRIAILDSTLVFFSLLTILYFIYLYEKKEDRTITDYFFFGCVTSLAVSTKMVGLVLVILVAFLLFKGANKATRLIKFSGSYLAGLILVFLSVYYVHMTLGVRMSEEDVRYKDVGSRLGIKRLEKLQIPSTEYIRMVEHKDIYNPLKLYVPIRDFFNFIKLSQIVLPRYDADPESGTKNGSRPMTWPLGIRNINYSFYDSIGTNDIWYVNFQGNPVNWLLGLIAVLFSLVLILVKTVSRSATSNTRTYKYLCILTSLYFGYMVAITFLSMQRVLYIHIYLLPLLFSLILFFILFNYIFEEYIIKRDRVLYAAILLLMVQVFFVYYRSSPVTYAKPISYVDCENTRLIGFWEDLCHR